MVEFEVGERVKHPEYGVGTVKEGHHARNILAHTCFSTIPSERASLRRSTSKVTN